jgi:hypothetical protein
MLLQLYLTIVAVGAGATYAYAIREDAVPFMTLLGTTSWAMAALQARNIVLYHQDGTSTVVGSEAFQYFALGLAILSFMAFTLWYMGEFPVQESDEPGEARAATGGPE